MATKKVKITVTKKKVNLKKIIITIVGFLGLIIFAIYIANMPIRNIYITGNNIVPDKKIIELSRLSINNTPLIKSYFINIEENILKEDYIKSVKVKRKKLNKIYIEVEEYKPLAFYKNELILSSKKKVNNNYNINYLPYIVNDIDKLYDKFVTSFTKVNNDILFKISHLEYVPNEVDKERFILYMIDDNYVYVTLNKITKINKYNSIINELENKKGIIYLDSGDYIEIKD